MESIWVVVVLFAGFSLISTNLASLIAGLILAGIGIIVEKVK